MAKRVVHLDRALHLAASMAGRGGQEGRGWVVEHVHPASVNLREDARVGVLQHVKDVVVAAPKPDVGLVGHLRQPVITLVADRADLEGPSRPGDKRRGAQHPGGDGELMGLQRLRVLLLVFHDDGFRGSRCEGGACYRVWHTRGRWVGGTHSPYLLMRQPRACCRRCCCACGCPSFWPWYLLVLEWFWCCG